jgi:succinoglycan biosynthesis protein ExoV
MKLFYCHIPGGNFGDELNTYLWPRLLPDAFSGTEQYTPKADKAVSLADPRSKLFVGIGTLIRSEVPDSATKHVFGSGFGYGKIPPQGSNWNFHCVRGPLTAHRLGLAPEKAITDPAVLVGLLPREPIKKIHRFSFIPHWEMAESGDWENVCRLLGINYIDPRWTPSRVIQQINMTRTLITEALHGAIVADTLRVPWMPVASPHTVLRFKWEDWCRSVGVGYAPTPVPTFWQPRPGIGRLINTAKEARAAVTLFSLMHWGTPILSGDGVVESLTDRLLTTLASFCKGHQFTLNLSPQH